MAKYLTFTFAITAFVSRLALLKILVLASGEILPRATCPKRGLVSFDLIDLLKDQFVLARETLANSKLLIPHGCSGAAKGRINMERKHCTIRCVIELTPSFLTAGTMLCRLGVLSQLG